MPNLFYYLYRCYLTMWTARMKMSRGGTTCKSWASFMRDCITGVLGPGTTAMDAHFATTRSWRVSKCSGACKRTGRWLLQAEVCSQGGARRVCRVPGEASGSCRLVRWDVESNYVRLSILNDGSTMLVYVYAYYLCLSMFNLCLLMSNCGIWMQSVRLMESTSIGLLVPFVICVKFWPKV